MTRIDIEPTPSNGLEQPSRLMIDKLTTIPRANVGDLLFRLPDADVLRLNRALLVFLGLAD